MLKIFNIDDSSSNSYNHLCQMKDNIKFGNENFERTLAGIGTSLILDLEKRSSWTHKEGFSMIYTEEICSFFDENKIIYENPANSYNCDKFSLLKYEM